MYKPVIPLILGYNEGIRKNLLGMPNVSPRRKNSEDYCKHYRR